MKREVLFYMILFSKYKHILLLDTSQVCIWLMSAEEPYVIRLTFSNVKWMKENISPLQWRYLTYKL